MALAPEAPPTNILSERLSRLLTYEIIERIPSPDGTKHRAYQLTPKGKALRPLLESMRDWGLRWEPGTEAKRTAPAGTANNSKGETEIL